MRIILVLALASSIAGCLSTPRVASPPTIGQTLSVECVSSNTEPSGCTTSHEIVIATTLTSDGSLPTAEDLQSPDMDQTEF